MFKPIRNFQGSLTAIRCIIAFSLAKNTYVIVLSLLV